MGQLECVRSLVEAGADKNIANRDGRKPIDVVCKGYKVSPANKGAIEALLR